MDKNNQNNRIKASPAARRIAQELGLDLREIAQDVQGRIQIKDVELYHQKILSKQETIEAEIDQIDQEISEEELTQEEIQAPVETTESIDSDDSDTVPDTDIEQETNFTLVEETQEDESVQLRDEGSDNIVQVEEESDISIVQIEEEPEPTPVSVDQNFAIETVELEPEFPILIEQPEETVLIAEENMPGPIDKPVIQIDEISDPIEEEDEDDLFIPPIPISISFEVSDLPIRNMLSGLDVPLQEGLVDSVVKACCSAFIKAEISLYENRINLVKIKEKNLVIQTASNFENRKISELEYDASQEDDDILINIWDMTDYEFNSVQKADVDSVNLFILWNKDKITVDLTCDEFIMEIGECTYYMHMLKKYLDNPILMLL